MRAHPALVLNADFQPLNYFPLSTMDWETAVKNVYEGNLSIVAEYDTVVRSPSTTMRLPSVVAMRDFVPIPKRVAFTRFNVFLRDRFRCQYCGQRFTADQLTFDHVKPRSWWRDGMEERRGGLRSLQPAQVQSIRHAASAHAGRTDIAAAHCCQADVPAQLPARKLVGLSVLGQRDRELTVT
jgi:5-methylcytosine-specific restriction endonuclease McrA